jgi:lysophospholipase L1-like esterase
MVRAACLLVALLVLAPAAPAAPGRYVAVGDSLGAGLGASNPGTGGYVTRVFDALRTPGPYRVRELRNRSSIGATSFSAASSPDAIVDIDDDRTDTRVVSVMIGGNDLRNSAACAARAAGRDCPLRRNLDRLFRRLRAALDRDPGKEALVAVTYLDPWSGTGTATEAASRQALVGRDGRVRCRDARTAELGLDDLLACRVRRFGGIVADVHPRGAGRGAELTHSANGDPHYTDAGYALTADTILRRLRP